MNRNSTINILVVMAALTLAGAMFATGQEKSYGQMYRLSFTDTPPRQLIEYLSEISGQTISISTNVHHHLDIALVTEQISLTEAVYLLVEQLWRNDIRIIHNAKTEYVARERTRTEPSAAEPYLSDITRSLTGAADISAIASKHALPSLAEGEQPFLEILSLTPETPAVISEGQRITAEIRYGCASSNAVRIWLRSQPPCNYSPSWLEPGGIGRVERSVWLGSGKGITNLKAHMVEQDTQKTLAELNLPTAYTKNTGLEVVPGLSFHEYQCLPGQNTNIFVCEFLTVIASYSNQTQNTYYFDLSAKDRNGRTMSPNGHSGLGTIRPGTGSVQVRQSFDHTNFIDTIMLQVLTTNRERTLTVGEIDADIIYSIPRPDVPENPLFNGLEEVSYHPDLPGIDDVKRVLYERGLKRLGMSNCPTTHPVIIIDQDVPVEAAQEVLLICRDYLLVPIKDIQCEEIEPGRSPGKSIYVGVQRRPRYAEYPAERLDRLLKRGLTQDQFIHILQEP